MTCPNKLGLQLGLGLQLLYLGGLCVRGDTIHATDANATNAILGTNSAIALASSINDPSVVLVTFNQKDIFVEVKLT